MPRRNLHLRAALADFCDLTHILYIQLRVDALGEHVVSHVENVYIARALTIPEEGAFHTVRTGEKCQLRGRHGASPVIVRMHAEDDALTVLKMGIHPLNLIRVYIGRSHLHRGGKVYNDRVLLGRPPGLLYRRTNIQSKIKFRTGKALRRILQAYLGIAVGHILLHQLRAHDGDLLDLLPVLVEHHIPLKSGGGIVNVDNSLLDPLKSLKCPLNQMLPALNQHLHFHVVGDQLAVHQRAQKIIFNLRCRRKSHLNLLKAQLYKKVEHLHLLLNHHGLYKSLIAVSEIHAAPYRRLLNLFIRPGALRKIHYGNPFVSLIV